MASSWIFSTIVNPGFNLGTEIVQPHWGDIFVAEGEKIEKELRRSGILENSSSIQYNNFLSPNQFFIVFQYNEINSFA
jgi:hypothetical protein